MKVKDIMSKNPIVVHPETPIHEIEKIFERNKFWGVYVGEHNDFVGIITRNDLRTRAGSYSLSTPAREIMSEGVISIDENADVEDAQRMLSSRKINGIAVTRNGKHVGIVTRYDIRTKKQMKNTQIFEWFSSFAIGAILLVIGTGLLVFIAFFAQSISPHVQSVPTPIITLIPQSPIQKAIVASIPTETARIVQTNSNSGGNSAPSISNAGLEKRVHELINEQRNRQGLSSLSFDSSLAAIARGHSQDMARNNYFSHENLQGLSTTDRGNQQGYPCRKDYGSYYTYGLAENIYQNNLYYSVTYYNGIQSYDWKTQEEIAQSTVEGWMNSQGHRKNILTLSYDREGIGVAIATDYKVYITEDFC